MRVRFWVAVYLLAWAPVAWWLTGVGWLLAPVVGALMGTTVAGGLILLAMGLAFIFAGPATAFGVRRPS